MRNKKLLQMIPYIALILVSLNAISFCSTDAPILFMQFKTKSLREPEDTESYVDVQWDDYPVIPPKQVYNTSQFLNEWFYNGMYHTASIGGHYLNTYINSRKSDFSIEKCSERKAYSSSSHNYKPSESSTYSQIADNIGNDLMNFNYDTLHYEKLSNIGGKKGEGLDFYYSKVNETALCGKLGLNLNTDSEKTNIISQLKKRNYIEKYIWTLKYQTEESGLIIMGNEPHFYENKTYMMSQYCSVYSIPTKSSKISWSFQFDNIYYYNTNKQKVSLEQNIVKFSFDKGLIIGTDEYKKKIDESFFSELVKNEICHIDTQTFKDEEQNTQDEYYIYYCSQSKFVGKGLDSLEDTPYNRFPNLVLYFKSCNMTFTLDKHDLFIEKIDRIYFLVIFKKSNTENNMWELGEPFFYKTRYNPIVFNEDSKAIGFYNSALPKISNEEYIKNQNNKKENNSNNSSSGNIWLYIGIGVGIIILVALAYYLGKVLNDKRKKRANELNDEFDYVSGRPINSNEGNQEEKVGNLGI